jgi:hypothetical protein
VHIKQYVEGDLNDSQTEWKGEAIDSDAMDYYSLPWEIEAFGVEVGLWTNYAKKEVLWNVFEGVRDPDRVVEAEPIGWLNEDKLSKTKRPSVATNSKGLDTEKLSTPHIKRREEHQHGSTGRGRTTFRSWIKSISFFD